MLDMKFVRENPDAVKENIKKKFQDAKLPLVDEVIALDAQRRANIQEADQLRADRNRLSKQVGMLIGQAKKDPSKLAEAEAVKKQVTDEAERLAALEKLEAELDEKIHHIMLQIPQIIDPSVPIGPDDSCNVEVQRFGEPVTPDFEIPYHTQIMESFNGIDMDANDPATDKHIPFNYSIDNFEEGKAKCKEALQDRFGLNKDGSPVFGMVSRMVGMKGFDLVQSVADGLVDRGIELVILGSGESQYENFFSELCARHPGRVGTYIGFEPALSQEIYAGADAFIMPSKSEPCGLAQMVACRYGTPPIVRETGGLRDSIHDSTMGDGNGFTFAGYNAHELYEACWRAKEGYWNKEGWPVLVKRAMECDFSWSNSAKSYEGLYNEVVNLW